MRMPRRTVRPVPQLRWAVNIMRQYDEALPSGDRIADYAIKEVLGEPGSFGITYLATDLQLQREVAIKEYYPASFAMRRGKEVLPRDDTKAGTFDWGLERFSAEARTLAQFNHRNIVRVLRLIADVNGTAYIVMELAKGDTLESMIEASGPMDAEAFNPIFDQLLDGCAAIHKIGILHRDIKPSNIIISAQGVPILIDFGAARDLALQKKSGFTAIVTDTYSPPEQYSREQAQGPWTDIYALAATAYYALSGGPPPPSTARAIGDATVPASEAAAGRASIQMLKGLDKGLVLAAKDRPQSIEQWREQLDLTPQAQTPATTPVKLDRRAVIAVGAGLGLLGVVGATFILTAGNSGGSRVLDDQQGALKIAWTKDFGALDGDPWPALANSPRGVMLASWRLVNDQPHMLAMHVSNDGATLGEWVAQEAGSAAQSIILAPDGGAFIGGDEAGQARIVRLGPDWTPQWSRTFGNGEARSLILQGNRLIAAIGGDNGSAKLVVLDDSGQPIQGEISLLDRKDDTVERVVTMKSGYAVLGRRTAAVGDLNTTRLWVERLDNTYNSTTGRILEAGLGTTRGWAIAVVDDAIFVGGTTSKGKPDDPTHPLLIRINGADGSKTWTRIFDQVEHGSGRALALVPGQGRQKLYFAGTGGQPFARARLVQVSNDGSEIWTMEVPSQPGAEAEGALAASFTEAGDGFAAGFTHSSASTRLLLSRLIA